MQFSVTWPLAHLHKNEKLNTESQLNQLLCLVHYLHTVASLPLKKKIPLEKRIVKRTLLKKSLEMWVLSHLGPGGYN